MITYLEPDILECIFQGQRSLAGYSPRDHKESDTASDYHHIERGHFGELWASWRRRFRGALQRTLCLPGKDGGSCLVLVVVNYRV